MLFTKRNFHKNRKTTITFDVIVRASFVLAGAALAWLVLEEFLAPHVVYAEESQQQMLLKQTNGKSQSKYDLKIRESLNLQKDFGNPVLAFQTLDQLFSTMKKKIAPLSKYNKEEAIETLKLIGRVLKEENFEYRKNILLIEGLIKQENGIRYIDCDDYSSLFLLAGECLGLSLDPVYAPKHLFLLCKLDNNTSFYWEPTLASEMDISFYKKWLNISEGSDYPLTLNEKEFEAIQFCNLGIAWYEKGDYKKAVELSEIAVWLNPHYAEAYNNLGVAYAKQGYFAKAMSCYKKATRLNSHYATAFINLGVAFYKLGYLKKAVEYFERAIKVDPRFKKAYDYKIAVLIKNGERKEAYKFLEKIHKLKQKTGSYSSD